MRAAFLGQGSSSGVKGLEAGLIELSKMSVRKDIEITMPETLINSIDSMEPDHLVRTMVEFSSNALILGRRVGSLYRRELKEGNVRSWRSCKVRLISLRKKRLCRRRRGKSGRRRKRDWGPRRFAAWTQRRSLKGR